MSNQKTEKFEEESLEKELESIKSSKMDDFKARAGVFLRTSRGKAVAGVGIVILIISIYTFIFPSDDQFEQQFQPSARIENQTPAVQAAPPAPKEPEYSLPENTPEEDIIDKDTFPGQSQSIEAPALPALPEVDIPSPDPQSFLPEEEPEPEKPKQEPKPEPKPEPEPKKLPQLDAPPPLEQPSVQVSSRPKFIDPKNPPPPLFDGSGAMPSNTGIGINDDKGGKSDFIFIGDDVSLSEVTESQTAQQITNLQNTIAQGRVINAVLETAINSQIPGVVRAVISNDVYGELADMVLIPKGSRLYGTYSTMSSAMQNRLAITWNRLIRPDGVSIAINSQAIDQFGRTGVEGDLDRKYIELFQRVAMLSLINLGIATAVTELVGDGVNGSQTTFQNVQGTASQVNNLNPITTATQQTISTIDNVARQILEDSVNANTVITITQGTRVNVMVNQDLLMPRYRKISKISTNISN